MLRGEKLATCVRQNYSAAVQIDHLNRFPTSIQTKINPDFATTLESKTTNPAKAYEFQMKRLLREDLGDGLKDRASSLHQKDADKSKKQGTDGVLRELQKNGMKYSMVLQNRMNRQEERKRLFIDEDKLKNSKINQFVDKREDKDVFNHGSDLYQEYQRMEHYNSMSLLQQQKEAKAQLHQQMLREKQAEEQKRLIFEQQLAKKNLMDRIQKKTRQQQYGSDLANLVNAKIGRDTLDRTVAQSMANKHNPITNPIEYHIDNPYLIKRMQDRHRY